jgi:hypothetical protein
MTEMLRSRGGATVKKEKGKQRPSKLVREQVRAAISTLGYSPSHNRSTLNLDEDARQEMLSIQEKAFQEIRREYDRVEEKLAIRLEWQALEKALATAERKLADSPHGRSDSMPDVVEALKAGKDPEKLLAEHQRAIGGEQLWREVIEAIARQLVEIPHKALKESNSARRTQCTNMGTRWNARYEDILLHIEEAAKSRKGSLEDAIREVVLEKKDEILLCEYAMQSLNPAGYGQAVASIEAIRVICEWGGERVRVVQLNENDPEGKTPKKSVHTEHDGVFMLTAAFRAAITVIDLPRGIRSPYKWVEGS